MGKTTVHEWNHRISLFDSQTPQSFFYYLILLFEPFAVQDNPPNANSIKSDENEEPKSEFTSNKYAHPVDASAFKTNPTVSE